MAASDDTEHPGTRLRKHRHDLGHEDHGPKVAAGTTRAIQTLLGLWIALTLVLVVYVFIDSARHRDAAAAAGSAEVAPGSTGAR
jgi:hypothetical protein